MANAPGASAAAPSVTAVAVGGSTVVSPLIKQNQVAGDMILNFNAGPGPGRKKGLQQCASDLRSFLSKQKKYQTAPCGSVLSKIYTDLLITEEKGEGWLETHHEMVSVECQRFGGMQVDLLDIFQPSPGEQDPPQRVLMKGIAGVGKSVAVQKFTQDWAMGNTNQNLQLLFPFSFRELNHLAERELSLKDLIDQFYVKVKDLSPEDYDTAEVLFVFDGLDESRFRFDVNNEEVCGSMEQKTTIGVILSNLLTGQLLHRSKVWVTSRPTAAANLPEELFDRVTYIHGFSDERISEFFRKTIPDQTLAEKILEHLGSKYLQNLMVMCRIPLFSWLAAKSLESLLKSSGDPQLPKTMTQMYIHFLIVLVQKNRRSKQPEADRDFVMKLGKLAYNQMEKNHIIFYKQALTECGLDLDDKDQELVVAGFCIQILRKVCGLYNLETYSFIHLTVQEFLAALYVLESFLSSGTNLLPEQYRNKKQEILLVQQDAMEMALKCPNGRWDLFLRFLFGLSEEQNQELLQRVLGPRKKLAVDKKKTISYITGKIRHKIDRNRTVNLFHCLSELGDSSLVEEVRRLSRSGSVKEISPVHWSALAYLILVSNEDLETFELKKYFPSDNTLERLQPVLNAVRTAELRKCNLTSQGCMCVSAVLSMKGSNLEEVNLSNNPLLDIGAKMLCQGLRSTHCRLKTLRLDDCQLTGEACEPLSHVLKSSCLTELDLSYNQLQDSGVHLLLAGLECGQLKIKILRLVSCDITDGSCKSLASALGSNLRELDLSHNHLRDSGVTLLSEGMKDSRCKLEALRLSGCQLTHRGCASLSSGLASICSSFIRLDLSDNDLQDSGVRWLSDGLSPCGELESLRLSGCMISEDGCRSLARVLESNSTHLKALDLSYNHPGHFAVPLPAAGPNDPGLRKEHCGPHRIRPGPRKYWCNVSLDQNTANKHLELPSALKVTSQRGPQRCTPHEDRFNHFCQVLGQKELQGQCYWEVDWTGDVEVAVTYKRIKRRGREKESRLGRNDVSWSLRCSKDLNLFSVWHDNKETNTPCSSQVSKVAVHLDWDAGRLSYFGVSEDTLTLIHTFNCAFTEPVLPGFWLPSGLKKSVDNLKSFLGKKRKFPSEPHSVATSRNGTDLLISVEKQEGRQETRHEMGMQVDLLDIFQPSPGEQDPPQRVLMKGIAGVGKSEAVLKFIRDWAMGKTNQNLQMLFPFSFRELNRLAERELSLKDLIDHFYVEVKDLSPEDYDTAEVLFVFDGLDEKQFDLNLKDEEVCRSMEQKTTIGVILSNLLTGQMLHRSKVWVTSRPTAAANLPEELFNRVTYIHGFSDEQISEFFRKTIPDQTLAEKILEHLGSKYLQNLMVMCRIPLFSWLAAKSLESLLKSSGDPQLPKTMTQMYIHFLIVLVQKNRRSKQPEADRDFVMKLGKLAYNQWMKGNTDFDKEALTECGLSLDDKDQAPVVAGFLNQTRQKAYGLYDLETYSFIHLTVQEFLAALYVLESFLSSGANLLPEQYGTMEQKILLVQQDAMEMALKCPNGDWDSFQCFLFGLLVEENQELLERVLGPREHLEKEKAVANQTGKRRRKSVMTTMANWFSCLGPVPVPGRSLIKKGKEVFRRTKNRLFRS
ncbi:NACHT, LRR and PYD domains-containing protein 12-like [Neosynchiropus ocellatus]